MTLPEDNINLVIRKEEIFNILLNDISSRVLQEKGYGLFEQLLMVFQILIILKNKD